jgi:hypothetical protein
MSVRILPRHEKPARIPRKLQSFLEKELFCDFSIFLWSPTEGYYQRTAHSPRSVVVEREQHWNLMEITTQLALFLDNRPGMLARVCEALSEAKINIYAITTSDTVDHTVIRMIVSDSRKALLLFEERGTLVVETEVLMLTGENRPGALAKISQRLGEEKINIEYCYCATPPDAKKGLLILRVSNPKKALKILNS